jgi:hypothetical protein
MRLKIFEFCSLGLDCLGDSDSGKIRGSYLFHIGVVYGV